MVTRKASLAKRGFSFSESFICYNFHKRSLNMLTDTHCHLYLEQFAGDIDEVIRRATEAGVEKMLAPGMDLETSYEAVMFAEANSNIFAAVGFHPTDMQKFNAKNFDEICRLAVHP